MTVLSGETLVGMHSGKMFLVVGDQVWTALRRDFGPLLFTETLNIFAFLAAIWQLVLLSPHIFHRTEVLRC